MAFSPTRTGELCFSLLRRSSTSYPSGPAQAPILGTHWPCKIADSVQRTRRLPVGRRSAVVAIIRVTLRAAARDAASTAIGEMTPPCRCSQAPIWVSKVKGRPLVCSLTQSYSTLRLQAGASAVSLARLSQLRARACLPAPLLVHPARGGRAGLVLRRTRRGTYELF